MTNTPIEPPSGPKPVKRDEWIAIFVSLAAFSSIFFWATTRENKGFNLLSNPMLSTSLPETFGTPNIPTGESIFNLGSQFPTSTNESIFSLGSQFPIPTNESIFSLGSQLPIPTNDSIFNLGSQFPTPTDKSVLNIDKTPLTIAELGKSLGTLSPITGTVEELEEVEVETKKFELEELPKTTNRKPVPEIANDLARLEIGRRLSGSLPTASPEVQGSPIVPVAPPIASPTSSPEAKDTSPSPKAEAPESKAKDASPSPKAETPAPKATDASPSPKAETPDSKAKDASPSPKAETPESKAKDASPSPKAETPAPKATDTSKPPTKAPSPAEVIRFSDVPDSFWAGNFIYSLAEQDIISEINSGKYEPDKPVTRAEFANHVLQLVQEKSIKKSLNYEDVKENSTAKTDIQNATKSGFLTGYPGNVFRPDQQVSRVQVLVSLVTGLNLKAPSNSDEVLSIYKDKEEIPNWAKEKVAAATAAGLVVNHPDVTSLNPNQPATRAEVAAILYQAFVKLGEEKQVVSEYIVIPKK